MSRYMVAVPYPESLTSSWVKFWKNIESAHRVGRSNDRHFPCFHAVLVAPLK